jgi:hypothetical protein
VHGPYRLLDRRFLVGPVAELEVEIINLEAFQGLMAGFNDMLMAQPFLGRQITA